MTTILILFFAAVIIIATVVYVRTNPTRSSSRSGPDSFVPGTVDSSSNTGGGHKCHSGCDHDGGGAGGDSGGGDGGGGGGD